MMTESATGKQQREAGLRVLREDGPGDDESFEAWVQRIGGNRDSGGWDAPGSVMRDELQRLSTLWLKRGYIATSKDGTTQL